MARVTRARRDVLLSAVAQDDIAIVVEVAQSDRAPHLNIAVRIPIGALAVGLPTLVYIKGEFIGGCDIVKEMYENGELKKVLETKGIGFKK